MPEDEYGTKPLTCMAVGYMLHHAVNSLYRDVYVIHLSDLEAIKNGFDRVKDLLGAAESDCDLTDDYMKYVREAEQAVERARAEPERDTEDASSEASDALDDLRTEIGKRFDERYKLYVTP